MTPLGWIIAAALLTWGARRLAQEWRDRRRQHSREQARAIASHYLRQARYGRICDWAEHRRHTALLLLWEQLTQP